MDYVNLQVAIGGDVGNTVPKFFVPVSEVPVLAAIHGPDALFDFEQVDAPEGAEDLSNREEIARLNSIYGHVSDRDGNKILPSVYGGAGARVVTEIDDLELAEGAFKALERAKPKSEEKPAKKATSRKAATKSDEPKTDETKPDDGAAASSVME